MDQSLVETARGAGAAAGRRCRHRHGAGGLRRRGADLGAAVGALVAFPGAWADRPADYERLEKPPFNPPDAAFAIWGPLYAALTVSGARLWNARPSPARSRALAHWWGIQGLNAFWMWLGFGKRLRGAATLEAAATVVNAAAYVETARKVDPPAAWLAVPYAAWIGFAALLSEELWRRNR
ncbi:TspO/MBR family protein [Dankookia sp. P2]|uniref:TspO/MBR family protein n=1 Tax=Dankookia sp. P2 TaxID=3423955 RepID=UPI003D6649CA